MRITEYKKLLRQLKSHNDLEKLAVETNYDKNLLLVIYSQKVVQLATKKYHKIKHLAPKYRVQWLKGMSFLQISKKIGFPPVLTAALILKEDGISRKIYRKYLMNLEAVEDDRLRKELGEVLENDIIYSPEGNEIQAKRGLEGELKIKNWLTEHEIEFQTEKEISNKYEKTPDFLLRKPINVRGTDVHWIESKATFGNKLEIKKNLKNQLIPYRNLYKSGMVIYWFGFIIPPPMVEGILIESDDFFENWTE